MTAKEVLKELESLGSETTRKTMERHGIEKPYFGVKIGDMQKIRKQIRTDYQLALDLFDTGNYDAMYFAGLIADDEKMTKKNLRDWAKKAGSGSLSGYTVPWVATGNSHGPALALEWIESKNDRIASIGWSTLASLMSVKDDAELDLPLMKKLLKRVEKEIHKAGDDTRYWMNNFVIAVGSCIESLSGEALAAAERIGEVSVDHGDTSCKTPFAPDYIRKVVKMGRVGKKRKSAKC